MRKLKSIKMRLFAWYGILVVCIMFIFSLVFYFSTENILKKNASVSMLQISDTLNKEIDTLFKQINESSTRLLFSYDFAELFYSDMYNYKSESLKRQHQFNSLIYSSMGPFASNYQINIFKRSGEFIGNGNTSIFTKLTEKDMQKISWIPECEKNNGAKTIVGTHIDPLINNAKPVLSLCRTFSKQWGAKKDGFLEIQLKYSTIENIIKSVRAFPNNSDIKIFIFDSYGKPVYPISSEINNYNTYLNAFKNSNQNQIVAKIENQKQTIVKQTSKFTGFDVVIAQPYSISFAPIYKMRNSVFGLSLIALLFTLLITYKISKSLTMPIKHINDSINKLTLTALPGRETQMTNSNINELDSLILTYKDMCLRLQNSLDEVVSMRSAEMQSRMLALQSQMNPHFLYNTLTTISILANKGKDEKIVCMCSNLTDMMRYISSGSSNFVTIKEELQHTKSYIELMQIRFENELKLTIDIDQSIEDIKIPKLTIQPLVENCTKYATNCAPPWHIKINGFADDNKWFITVSDDGDGFSKETLDELNAQISNSKIKHDFHELNGMGLINIYKRIYLQYGIDCVFEYGNNSYGGAFVRIGGLTNIDKEDKYEFNI